MADKGGGKPKIGIRLFVALIVSFALTWLLLLLFVYSSFSSLFAQY